MLVDAQANKDNVIQLRSQQQLGRLQCPQCGSHTESKCNCGVDYVYVRASERAEKAIMENPEKSDRLIAEEIGVHQTTVMRVRRKSGDAKASPAKRKGKDGKKYPAKRTVQTALPDGYPTLSRAVMAGLESERSGEEPQKAAAKTGLTYTGYRRARDVVLLSERANLSVKDMEIVKQALQQLDANRVISVSYEMVRPIADKIWGPKGHRLKSDRLRMEAFNSSMSYLLTVCTSAVKLSIPYLSEEQVASMLTGIREAKQALDVLQRRIRKGEGEYNE